MDIVLGNYKGLKANIPYIAYTEEDVNSQIATLLSGNPVREQKTGPLAMGDTAVIDYEGFKDGVAFEGGKAEKYPLGIGSGSFIPGFEEQLVGMEIGEDRDINLSFPEPGSMVGALCCGLMYRFSKKIIPTCIAEALGTGILGGLAAYPLAKYVMLIQPEGMFIYIVPFLISTVAGSIVAAIVMLILKKNGALTVFKENLE